MKLGYVKICNSLGPDNDYYGIAIDPVAMREVGNASFRIKLSSSWNKSKLRYIVVVSTQTEDGLYEVCNVDGARLGESIQYSFLNNCKLVTMCLSPEFVLLLTAQIQGSVITNISQN